jgi:5-methyltetrahydropteroyltriglutamate--homocysteine methyltransferase
VHRLFTDPAAGKRAVRKYARTSDPKIVDAVYQYAVDYIEKIPYNSREAVQEILFNKINVHGYFMEYDDERSGGFEPLRMLPKGKHVVLGLVTTKSGKLENKDDLKRGIDQAAKYCDFDQLCLSGQCGFASTEEGNTLTEEEQWAKLRLIVEVANEVWG